MAEASSPESPDPLQDHLSCSVCFEMYDNPHALLCLHTFCSKCLDMLKHGPKVQCPECRSYTSVKLIKKDFKTQALVDIVKKKQLQEKKKREESAAAIPDVNCDMCKCAGKEGKWKCVNCDQVMCIDCEVTHRGMKICTNHHVVSIEEVVEFKQLRLNNTLSKLQEEKRRIDQASSAINDCISHFSSSKKQQSDQIKRIIDRKIDDLKMYSKELQLIIEGENGKVLTDLNKSKNVVSSAQNKITQDIIMIEYTLENEYELQKTSSTDIAHMEALVQSKINKLQKNLSETVTGAVLPVSINDVDAWDPSELIDLSVGVRTDFKEFKSGIKLQCTNSSPSDNGAEDIVDFPMTSQDKRKKRKLSV